MAELEAVIGLEIHVQLSTRTKMFCGCELSFGDEPNVHTCPVCLAHPGGLPVPNEESIRYALRELWQMEDEESVNRHMTPKGLEWRDRDFKEPDKYLDDGSQALVPAPLSSEQSDKVRAMALQVFKVLRCEGLARVDFFFEPEGRGFLCNEVNTMPGFTPISMYPKLWIASRISYPELIDELVRLAIERHGRQRRNTAH